MQSVGTSESHAAQLADLLLDADIVGHYRSIFDIFFIQILHLKQGHKPQRKWKLYFSHGLNRLCIYVEDVAHGVKGEGKLEEEVKTMQKSI